MVARSGGTAVTCATTASLWIDGRPADAAALAATQSNYGHLTTLQLRGGAVQGLQRHIERLQAANLELFGSLLAAERIRAALGSASRAAGATDATLRLSVHALDSAAAERGVNVEVTLLVAVSPPRTPPAPAQRVRSHVHARALAHLKHLATLPLLHARRGARMAGFDDALLVDAAGRVLEGSLWNVGFVDAAGIVWPEGDALRGVTEGLLRQALVVAAIPQQIRPVEIADLRDFRAAFACNSSGLWPLASIDDVHFAGEEVQMTRLRGLLEAVPWEPLAG